MARNALGLEFDSAARRLSKRPGSVWNCLWGNALKRSHGINRKSMVSYPVPGFLSSATWPSLPKKHYRYKTTVSSAREKVSIRLCAQKRTWRDLIGCKTHINNRG